MAAPWEQRQAADAPYEVGKLRLPEAVGGVKGIDVISKRNIMAL